MRNVANNVTRRFRGNGIGDRCPDVYRFYMRSSPWLRDTAYEIWHNISPMPFYL